MRSVVLSVGLSLDGYIARPDGAVDFLFIPKDLSMAGFFTTSPRAPAIRDTQYWSPAFRPSTPSVEESSSASRFFTFSAMMFRCTHVLKLSTDIARTLIEQK